MGKKPINFFLLLIIALTSIIIRGYSFGIGDQAIHLPLIYKLQNSSLYPNDYLFTIHQNDFSLFYPLMSNLLKIFNNVWLLFFILYVVISVLIFVLIALISKKLFKRDLDWFFALFFFIFPYYIGGSAIMSVETSFVPRLIGNLLSLYIIYLILNKKFVLSFLILSLEFLLHPLSAIPIGIILLFIIFCTKNIPRTTILFKGVCIFLIITGWFIYENLFQLKAAQIDFRHSEWLSILKTRNSYAFPLLWDYKGWLSLIIGLLPLIIYLITLRFFNRKWGERERFIYNLIFISICLLIFQILFTSIFPNPTIINIQLSRVFILPITISFITLGYFVNLLRKKVNLNYKKTIIIGIFLLVLLTIIRLPKMVTGQDKEWINSQYWVNTHLSEGCVFLVPFDTQGFRVFSKRTIVGEYKDGTLSFYSPQYAQIWYEKKTDLQNWSKLNIKELNTLQEKYDFSYLVNYNSSFFPLDLVYRNSRYSIYKMSQVDNGCIIINNQSL